MELDEVSHIVLPGQGSFPKAMDHLSQAGFISRLRQSVLEQKKPILGICVGMQVLAEVGYEGEKREGLGLVGGSVQKLTIREETERLPHVGWNEVHQKRCSRLLDGVDDGADFYFVHSFALECQISDIVISTTPYCGGFVSAIEASNVFGVQFHPEKSQKVGNQVLTNFLTNS